MSRPRGLPPAGRGDAGFTLVELAVSVMIVGILAGLVLPNLRTVLLKADAAHIVSDAHTVQVAAFGYLSDNGAFPSSGGPGLVPAQMVPHLPENFEFDYKDDVTYMWLSLTLPNTNNVWQSRNIGIFMINYSARQDLADPFRSHVGPNAYWSQTMFYYIWGG